MLSAAKKTLTCRLRARLLLRSILLGFVVQICPRIFHRRLVHRHRLKAHLWEFLPTSLARDRHQRRMTPRRPTSKAKLLTFVERSRRSVWNVRDWSRRLKKRQTMSPKRTTSSTGSGPAWFKRTPKHLRTWSSSSGSWGSLVW